MVKIRLKQIGKKKDKKYRVVAMESTNKRDGKEIEVLGFYDPVPDISIINLKTERIDYWLNKGAVMTERVAKLYDIVKSGKLIQNNK